MIKVTLKQGYDDIDLAYNTMDEVDELVRVIGSGQEIENLAIFIALEKPKEEDD